MQSVERATAFYTALGWTLNAETSDHNVSCLALAPDQYVMLGSREMYASVGAIEALVGGPDTPSKVTVSFDLGGAQAEAVDYGAVENVLTRTTPGISSGSSREPTTSPYGTTRAGWS